MSGDLDRVGCLLSDGRLANRPHRRAVPFEVLGLLAVGGVAQQRAAPGRRETQPLRALKCLPAITSFLMPSPAITAILHMLEEVIQAARKNFSSSARVDLGSSSARRCPQSMRVTAHLNGFVTPSPETPRPLCGLLRRIRYTLGVGYRVGGAPRVVTGEFNMDWFWAKRHRKGAVKAYQVARRCASACITTPGLA
jgi:hypothetical protein